MATSAKLRLNIKYLVSETQWTLSDVVVIWLSVHVSIRHSILRYHKFVFSFPRQLTMWHCPQLLRQHRCCWGEGGCRRCRTISPACGVHTHTHPFSGPFSGTIQVCRYQKGKTNLDFTEARDSEPQWHQLGRMQVCTSLQTDNHASTPPLSFFTGRMPFLPPYQQRQSIEGIPCSYLRGTQQQTRRTLLQRSTNGTDRRTDARQFCRPCSMLRILREQCR